MLKIVADENIPQIREALAGLGDVSLRHGRAMTREDLAHADALLVRSITRVDAALLEGTPVKFVGSATIGADHVDQAWLAHAGIAFTNAPGCNADSVVQYVFAALMELRRRRGIAWHGATLGIVGRGNIGSRLARVAPALGMRVLVNDPPLERAGQPGPFTDLETVLAESDIVTLHVPLNKSGEDCTMHLIGEERLLTMKPEAVLINAARGPVVDNAALREALEDHRIGAAVLDVWEKEPLLDKRLLGRVDLGTPHIAGYSMQGKLNGTGMVAAAMARHFGLAFDWQPSLPAPAAPVVELAEGTAPEEQVEQALLHTHAIGADDAALRAGGGKEGEAFAAHFDGLRKAYPVRLEPTSYTARGAGAQAAAMLRALGFAVLSD